MESLAAGPLTRGLTAQNLDGKKEHAVGNDFLFVFRSLGKRIGKHSLWLTDRLAD